MFQRITCIRVLQTFTRGKIRHISRAFSSYTSKYRACRLFCKFHHAIKKHMRTLFVSPKCWCKRRFFCKDAHEFNNLCSIRMSRMQLFQTIAIPEIVESYETLKLLQVSQTFACEYNQKANKRLPFARIYCMQVLQTFACEDYHEIETSYLRADSRIECYTQKHTMYRTYAAFMIVLCECIVRDKRQ